MCRAIRKVDGSGVELILFLSLQCMRMFTCRAVVQILEDTMHTVSECYVL